MKTNYQTFKQAGYTYIKYLGDGEHLLCNSDGGTEIFGSNKNHAGWALIYKNTHLEFCRNLHPDEVVLRSK
jgi:hypothetical protein